MRRWRARDPKLGRDVAIKHIRNIPRKAEDIISRLKELEKTQYVLNYWVAIVYAALGDKDAAFAELERAYQANDWFIPRLKIDPFMDPLRGDPRFNDLVKRIGLPQ